MKCQFCGQPASVHLTEIVQHQKAELHLCADCAEKHQLWTPPDQELNVPALLNLLLGAPAGAGSCPTCPECGLDYDQFRARGRLGCPHDYTAFATRLEELLLRVQRKTRHRGKTPARHPGGTGSPGRPDEDLRRQLARAVALEHYEEAARLRDLIRQSERGGAAG